MRVNEIHIDRQYKICFNAVSLLANLCAGDTNRIIDELTGYLWDEEDAGHIKEQGEDCTNQST